MEDVRDYLIYNGIATEEEVTLVCQINGESLDTMESILYARTGYSSLEQTEEEE